MSLLERTEQVAAVVERFRQLDRSGHLVLVSGEAGAGKSALVHELVDHHLGAAQVMVGHCDDLFAPRPLGPLADIARDRPGVLAEALGTGDQAAVFDAFMTEVGTPGPTVVVLEDLQWADEATLDLLRFVARRLDRLGCLVLATHRDDLPTDHPMRRAIGSLHGPLVSRVHLPPLSVDAVRTLVGDRHIDPVSLHARTAGNPFFLVEALDAEPGAVPATVRDAILARVVPLSGSARDALDAAVVLGRHVDAELIQVVGDCDSAAVDECIGAGLLVDDGQQQAFRHDLTRQAIEETMTPLRRRQLHARALDALDALGADGDIVRRAHHAIGAGDRRAIVDLAAAAADHCVTLGAWRQAAALYAEALHHAADLADSDRLRLLQARATIGLRVEQVDEAMAAGEEAYTLMRAAGDDVALSAWEAWLSKAYRASGRTEEAREAAHRAVARMEAQGDSPALAEALANLSGHLLVTGHYAECAAAAQRAIELAGRFDLEPTLIYGLNSYGAALASIVGSDADTDTGIAALQESLERAKRAGLHEGVTRACSNLAFSLVNAHRPAEALPVLDEGIATAEAQEMQYQLNCILPSRAEVLMLVGRWDAAIADLTTVLANPEASAFNRAMVLLLLGRVRARRGDPHAAEALDEALELALPFDEAQLIAPLRLARAEAWWLASDVAGAAAEVEATLAYAPLLDVTCTRDLARWAQRTGVPWTPATVVDEPTGHILRGDHRALAAFWEAHGYPYDAADALADSDDTDDVRRAFELLTALGARPRAQQATRRLRELGARDVPRGPRASTRANAAGLTARELEVAALLAEGLTNGEIAERLVVSQKTVDHHVSAVLTKLGVSTRRQVARAAADLGVVLHAEARAARS